MIRDTAGNTIERDIPFKLGEYGPAPRRDELVDESIYVIDGMVSTRIPCTSLAKIALNADLHIRGSRRTVCRRVPAAA